MMSDDGNSIFLPFDFTFAGCDYDDIEEEPQEKIKCGNEEGYLCVRCCEFYPFAELNMENKTFKCWMCRKGLDSA